MTTESFRLRPEMFRMTTVLGVGAKRFGMTTERFRARTEMFRMTTVSG
jgi:hypothetical protein